jgi:hypothetical protein
MKQLEHKMATFLAKVFDIQDLGLNSHRSRAGNPIVPTSLFEDAILLASR